MTAETHRMEDRLTQSWRKYFWRTRPAEDGEVFLGLRRVYIMPTAAGLTYAIMLVLLFIGSINYNLSLGFGLTFLLVGIGLIDMHLTFRNLAHLHLQAGRCSDVFAGEEARFELVIANRKKLARYALWAGFIDQQHNYPEQAFDLEAHSSLSLHLAASAKQRGWLAAPRVKLHTRFPLGLLQAWSYWQPPMQVLVYPEPELDAPALPTASSASQSGPGQAGQDDFAGIRSYQSGDALKHLAWRQIARLPPELGGQLVSKHFEGGASTHLLLDFAALPQYLDTEARLSRLTRWVIQAEQQGLEYAFHLGNLQLPLSSGLQHQQNCLRALALYELTAESLP